MGNMTLTGSHSTHRQLSTAEGFHCSNPHAHCGGGKVWYTVFLAAYAS